MKNYLFILMLLLFVLNSQVFASNENKLDPPKWIKASDGEFHDMISIEWDPVEGANYYIIYRSSSENIEDALPIWEGVGPFGLTTYNDWDIDVCHKEYTYWIKAESDLDGLNESDFSIMDKGWIGYPIFDDAYKIAYTGGEFGMTISPNRPECHWVLTIDQDWITTSSKMSGTNEHFFSFNVKSNSDSMTRTGNIIVSGRKCPIIQAGNPGDNFKINPPNNIEALNGKYSDRIPLKWECVENANYYEIHRSTNDNPNDAVRIVENSSPLWGHCFHNDFDIEPCYTVYYYWIKSRTDITGIETSDFSPFVKGWIGYNIQPESKEFDYIGGTGSIDIEALKEIDSDVTVNCPWEAKSESSWIKISSETFGNGNGTIYYEVVKNLNTTERTGKIIISGKEFIVTQKEISNIPPSITIPNQSISSAPGNDTSIYFNYNDRDSEIDQLQVTASSSNPLILSDSNFLLNYSNGYGVLNIQIPPDNPTETVDVKLSVNDSYNTVSRNVRVEIKKSLPYSLHKSNDTPLEIKDEINEGVYSVIPVLEDRKVYAMKLTLDIDYPFINDLSAKLISPSGTEVLIFDSLSLGMKLHLTFNEEAEKSINEVQGPYFGTYRPQESFNKLKGERIKGDWKLHIIDKTNDGDIGKLEPWRIEFFYSTPIADAGSDQIVLSNSLVQLNASKSYDLDDKIISFQWKVLEGKPGIILSDANSISPTFIAPEIESGNEFFKFLLLIKDERGNTGEDTCMLRIVDKDIKIFDSGQIDDEIPDDGTVISKITIDEPGLYAKDVNIVVNITHPCIDELGARLIGPEPLYKKILLFYPITDNGKNFKDTVFDDNSKVSIQDGSAPFSGYFRSISPLHPLINEPLSGEWKFQIYDLHTSCGGGFLNSWRLEVMPITKRIPQANAGSDLHVVKGAEVILDASKSFDLDKDIIEYKWDQISGTYISLVNPNAARTSFMAPDSNDSIVFKVTVIDETGLSDEDICIVKVGYHIYSYDSPIHLNGRNTLQAIIEVPEDGYVKDVNLELDLDHNFYASLSFFLISPEGTISKLVALNNIVFIDSDSDPQKVSTQLSHTIFDDDAKNSIYFGKPPHTDSFAPLENLSVFNEEIAKGEWKLIIADEYNPIEDKGILNSWKLEINITDETPKQPPIVDCGSDEHINFGDVVFLDGSNSYDPDGKIVSYKWRQIGGTDVSLVNSDSSKLSFTYLKTESDTLFFNLTVTDNDGIQSNKTKIVRAGYNMYSNENKILIKDNDTEGIMSTIDIPDDGIIKDINLEINISHPLVNQLSAKLVSPLGKTVDLFKNIYVPGENFTQTVLDDHASLAIQEGKPPFNASFKPLGHLNSLKGDFLKGEWKLIVSDTGFESVGDLDSWHIQVNSYSSSNPIADAGKDLNAKSGTIVLLDSSKSFDPDGEIQLYSWNQIKGPAINLSHPNSITSSFHIPINGFSGKELAFKVTVKDSDGLEASDLCYIKIDYDVYSSSNTSYAIPDGLKVPPLISIINVEDNFLIKDLNIVVNMSHNRVSDLQAKIISPSGKSVLLTNDLCNGQNMIDIIFDNNALKGIYGVEAPYITGSFKPIESLEKFHGEPANGNWKLVINDLKANETGFLDSWKR